MRMRAALAWLVLLVAAPLWADGGLVRLSAPAGPWHITVFTSPTPLRAGPVDLSVFVQDGTGAAVLDAVVDVHLRVDDGDAPAIATTATRAQATNKLLYAALFDVPAPGTWTVDVTVRAPSGSGSVSFTVAVEPPPPRWQTFWPWLAVAPVGMVLLALHQWLVLRR